MNCYELKLLKEKYYLCKLLLKIKEKQSYTAACNYYISATTYNEFIDVYNEEEQSYCQQVTAEITTMNTILTKENEYYTQWEKDRIALDRYNDDIRNYYKQYSDI